MSETLARFVTAGLERGHSKAILREKLLAAGWPADEIEEALDEYADVDFDVPVPRPRPYVSARDAFRYLVVFSLLYVSAISLGVLAFDIINRWFPLGTESGWQFQADVHSTRRAAAALIVAYPIYLLLTRRIHVATRQDPVQRTSKVRQWLTYLTLFVAASVTLCDVIAVLFRLLQGDPTPRFLLKTVVVAAIAGGVFAYYLGQLRADEAADAAADTAAPSRGGGRLLAGLLSLVVVATLVVGLAGVSGPWRARAERFDADRVADLRAIAAAVDEHWRDRATLPTDLETLAQRRGVAVDLVDPETGEPYRYLPGEPPAFRLCARFALDSTDLAATDAAVALGPRGVRERFWSHPAGEHCFELRAADSG